MPLKLVRARRRRDAGGGDHPRAPDHADVVIGAAGRRERVDVGVQRGRGPGGGAGRPAGQAALTRVPLTRSGTSGDTPVAASCGRQRVAVVGRGMRSIEVVGRSRWSRSGGRAGQRRSWTVCRSSMQPFQVTSCSMGCFGRPTGSSAARADCSEPDVAVVASVTGAPSSEPPTEPDSAWLSSRSISRDEAVAVRVGGARRRRCCIRAGRPAVGSRLVSGAPDQPQSRREGSSLEKERLRSVPVGPAAGCRLGFDAGSRY